MLLRQLCVNIRVPEAMKPNNGALDTVIRRRYGKDTAVTRMFAEDTAFSMRACMRFVFIFFSNITYREYFYILSIGWTNCRITVSVFINIYLCRI